MAFCEATASQLLKLGIMVFMVMTLINADVGELHDLTSAADATVRNVNLNAVLSTCYEL